MCFCLSLWTLLWKPDLCRFDLLLIILGAGGSVAATSCSNQPLFFLLHHLSGNFAIQKPISVCWRTFCFFCTTRPWPHKAACPLSGWRLLPCQQWSTAQSNLQALWTCLRTHSRTNMPPPLGRNPDGKERHNDHPGVLDHAKRTDTRAKASAPNH